MQDWLSDRLEARGALPLAHSAPLGSRAELGLCVPRRAALEPLWAAAKGAVSAPSRLAGGEVDRTLLQQLRVIALEMQPFL